MAEEADAVTAVNHCSVDILSNGKKRKAYIYLQGPGQEGFVAKRYKITRHFDGNDRLLLRQNNESIDFVAYRAEEAASST